MQEIGLQLKIGIWNISWPSYGRGIVESGKNAHDNTPWTHGAHGGEEIDAYSLTSFEYVGPEIRTDSCCMWAGFDWHTSLTAGVEFITIT